MEDMRSVGLTNVEGIVLTSQAKEEVASGLKQVMLEKRLQIPYDPDLINQLNIETFERTKEGRVKFFHGERTHDDHFEFLL